ncbi:hypothetical protein CPB83DRAFT_865563 [Crepidotus variabilis]|uniref:CS domain-containing protein n=1 Tax=Crepidotus variabilis TaxID=179855 RepID=A0A9P6BBK8_9AGAR|nr:hypothetical protein CPB83DRAFT_865563 [Crepidotus variabilis]
MDKYNERAYYPYSWHQATVLVMVPSGIHDEDLSVVIDKHHLLISAKNLPAIVQGRMYGSVDTASSVWQLEPRGSRLPSAVARERTISSTSTASSTHSSFAFVSSDPDISSSFAASLESGQASDAEDIISPSPAHLPSTLSFADDGLYRMPRRRLDPNPVVSRSVSPGHAHPSMTSSLSSLDSAPSPRPGRLLTVHLEKDQSVIWPSLIVGPVPESLASSLANTVVVFDATEEFEEQYNMDPTSLALIGLEQSDIRKDKEAAFEFFLRAWQKAHVPSATMRLVSQYLPIGETNLSETSEKPACGTPEYYLHALGGSRGLAQLYLEAGLLHLEGAASTLLAASYSSLSSIRIPLHAQIGEGGAEAWRRDREAAARFFDRARILYPGLDIPGLPKEGEMELEMPTMNLAPSAPESEFSKEEFQTDSEQEVPVVRRRRKPLDKETSLFQPNKSNSDLDNMDGAWYLYVPNIVGAGTALLVVGIVGALSFSNWSRRNQGS